MNIENSTLEKIESFCFYLTSEIENELKYYFDIIRRTPLPPETKSLPTYIQVASAVPTVIPKFGAELSKVMLWFGTKWNNKNCREKAKTIFYLVNFYQSKREEFRTNLVEYAVTIFHSFEDQFKKLVCDQEPNLAMLKLAVDIKHRILQFLLKNKQQKDTDLEKDFKKVFIDAFLNGTSIEKLKQPVGKTVQNQLMDENWKTADIFTKVGLVFDPRNGNQYFATKKSDTDRYGYRRAFHFEEIKSLNKDWKAEIPAAMPNYEITKTNIPALCKKMEAHVSSQNKTEEIKVKQEENHMEVIEHINIKHMELVKNLEGLYLIVRKNQEFQNVSNEDLLKKIEENQNILQTQVQKSLAMEPIGSGQKNIF